MKKEILEIAKLCKEAGLASKDYDAIISLVNAGEFRMAIEWAIDQLYEFDIQIGKQLYERLQSVADKQNVASHRRALLQSLVT